MVLTMQSKRKMNENITTLRKKKLLVCWLYYFGFFHGGPSIHFVQVRQIRVHYVQYLGANFFLNTIVQLKNIYYSKYRLKTSLDMCKSALFC